MVLLGSFWLPLSSYAACSNPAKIPCVCENYPTGYCIATGNKKFTYYQIGKNLAEYVAPKAGINLMPVEGGSIMNVKKMRWQYGVKFAIVQSDVLEHFRENAKNGNAKATDLIRLLRVLLPLYKEEVHMLVRADSDMEYFHDIKDKSIAFVIGGSAMTGLALYQKMFGEDPLVKLLSSKQALRALIQDKTVDVVIMVAGQPTPMFAKLGEDAKQLFKLLKYDDTNEQEKRILQGPYYQTVIHKDSYKWLDQDSPTIAVKAFLITQIYTKSGTRRKIQSFIKSLCKNFSTLQTKGHSKWKEVKLELSKLPGGWKYSQDVKIAFQSADCQAVASDAKSPHRTCATMTEMLLGLCD